MEMMNVITIRAISASQCTTTTVNFALMSNDVALHGILIDIGLYANTVACKHRDNANFHRTEAKCLYNMAV